jgi:hypothetical protein
LTSIQGENYHSSGKIVSKQPFTGSVPRTIAKKRFMKKMFFALALVLSYSGSLLGQSDSPKGYSNFPLIITLQFHAFAVPGRDLKSNFRNPGIGIGTEFSYNGKADFVQQINVVWYRNKNIGNGFLFYTQPVWRPIVSGDLYAEVKAGVGYLLARRPIDSFKQVNGTWRNVGRRGKGMLAVPIGISVGYNSSNDFSTFLSYQFMVVKNYNKSIPLVPETLVQAGSRIH